MRHIILPTLFLLFVTVNVNAAGLVELYRMARERDPFFLAEYHKRTASEEILKQAQATWLPQVSGSVLASRVKQDIISSDNTVFASGETVFDKKEYTIDIRQSLLNYTKWMTLKKADATVKRHAAEFTAAEQNLIKMLVEKYFAVLAANASINYIMAEKQSVQQQYELVEAKMDRGLVNSVEYQDAQARMLQVASREIELRNALENSKLDLKSMLGELPDSLNLMTENITLVTPSPASPADWIESAYDQNPSIVAKRFELLEARKEIQMQKGGHFPTLDVSASYNRDDTGGTLFGGGSEVDTGIVMLELNVPIYSGGATSSRLRQSVAIHSQVSEELRAMMMTLERDIVTAFNGVNNSIAKVEALDKLVDASEASVKLKRTAYEAGLASTLDVLDAERNLFFARSEFARARYEYVINSILLKRAAGLLDESDVENVDTTLLSTTDVLPLF